MRSIGAAVGGLLGATGRGLARPAARQLWGRQVRPSPALTREFPSPDPAWIPQTTLGYVETARPQFLSLRQTERSAVFSEAIPWQLSSVTEAISNLSLGPPSSGNCRIFLRKACFSPSLWTPLV